MTKPKTKEDEEREKRNGYTLKEIREMQERGHLINDDGTFCREVSECGCRCCRGSGYPDDWSP